MTDQEKMDYDNRINQVLNTLNDALRKGIVYNDLNGGCNDWVIESSQNPCYMMGEKLYINLKKCTMHNETKNIYYTGYDEEIGILKFDKYLKEQIQYKVCNKPSVTTMDEFIDKVFHYIGYLLAFNTMEK